MKAIIIGAGVAGIVTALSLQKMGVEFELVEEYESLNAYGAGIWLAPNALKILEQIDKRLLDDIKANGRMVNRFGVTNHLGDPISMIDMDKVERALGYRHVTIHRKVLIELLASYLDQPILFNKVYDRHTEIDDGVNVHFKNGTSVKGSFVVACDGVGSVVRGLNFGEIEPRSSGQVCWRAIVNCQVDKEYKGCFYEMWDVKNRTRVGHASVSDSQVYIFITAMENKSKSEGKLIKEYLIEKVKDYVFDIESIIKSSKESDWLCHELTDFKPIDNWYTNKVVLVGDAAHAMTPNLGQGGNQAIESAYCLAKQLHQNKNYEEAFCNYQSIRKDHVAGYIIKSWSLGQFVNMSPGILKNFLIWMMKRIPKNILLKQSIKNFTPKV